MSTASTALRNDTRPLPLPVAALAVKPRAACGMIGCGITRLYELIAAGELTSFKDGASRKIVVASIHEYIARRIAASSAQAA